MNINRLALIACAAAVCLAAAMFWADARVLLGPHGASESSYVAKDMLWLSGILFVIGLGMLGHAMFAQRRRTKTRTETLEGA